MENCHECGASTLPIWPNETLPTNDQLVSWRCFQQKLIGLGEDGVFKKQIKNVSKRHQPFQYLATYNETHNFIARWEDVHYRLSMDSLPSKKSCPILILQRITILKCKMKFSPCIGIHFKLPSQFTSLFKQTKLMDKGIMTKR